MGAPLEPFQWHAPTNHRRTQASHGAGKIKKGTKATPCGLGLGGCYGDIWESEFAFQYVADGGGWMIRPVRH